MSGAPTIHCLPLSTPFAVGRVNTYLIDDDPLTLVDTGPNSGSALVDVVTGLGEHGYRIEDLGRIVLTHQHIDHIGLAGILAERSGAEVCALAPLVPFLANYAHAMKRDDHYSEYLMRRHGIPDEVRLSLRAVSASFHGWGASVDVTTPLHDGEELAFAGGRFAIHHRPGHSPSDTIFVHESGSVTLGGDHLLKTISSNPLISRPLEAPVGTKPQDIPRPHALRTYLESLRRTAALEVGVVLPGHGEPVTDPAALVAERAAGHTRRAERILGLLREHGPQSAHGLARLIWGNVGVTQAYMTLSEVLGHTDILELEGAVEALDDGEVVRFQAR